MGHCLTGAERAVTTADWNCWRLAGNLGQGAETKKETEKGVATVTVTVTATKAATATKVRAEATGSKPRMVRAGIGWLVGAESLLPR